MSSDEDAPCRFGYEEHDGSRYCFEHYGFLNAGVRPWLCDRYPVAVGVTGEAEK